MTFALVNRSMNEKAFAILTDTLARRFAERGCALGDSGFEIAVTADTSLENDRFTVTQTERGVLVSAANEAAVFAGIGRFLTESRFDGFGYFEPAPLPIDFTPALPLRGLYFATHAHNFYHEAPIETVCELIADLALRGCNALLVWFDMHHYSGIDDPDAVLMIERLHALLAFAEDAGLKTALLMLANEGFKGTPAALQATNELIGGYFAKPAGFYHTEICPSAPGGMDEILRQRRQVLNAFADIRLDYVCLWPYDQGGCTCEKCQPWGVNGYMRILPRLRDLLSEVCPGAQIIVSTWYFDRFVNGEWDGFVRLIEEGKLDFAAYIMSFFAGNSLPAGFAGKDITSRVKFIDFPEISMRCCYPWGGCGTNAYGRFLDRTFNLSGNLYSGGFPYSEGRYEDINKAICLAHYNGMSGASLEAIRRYVRFEFCSDSDALVNAIADLEDTLPRRTVTENGITSWIIEHPEKIESIYQAVCEADRGMSDSIRQSWRWRMVYNRAVLDHEMQKTGGVVTGSERSRACLNDLVTLSFAQKASRWTHPPVDGWDADKEPAN